MRIFIHKALVEYYTRHPESKGVLEEWYFRTKASEWDTFADMKNTFNSVDSVGNRRYVFNIKGNAYRIVAIVLFIPKYVYIRFIGNHAEYDKITDCSKI